MDNQFVRLAVVLGLALIVTAVIAAGVAITFLNQHNTVTSSGVARTTVQADSAYLLVTISTDSADGSDSGANKKLEADTKTVTAFLGKHDVLDMEMTVEPITTTNSYEGSNASARDIQIRSSRVSDMAALAGALSTLSVAGETISVSTPEYYYTKIPELQITLAGEALASAQAQAKAIARQSGHSLGSLQSSSSRDPIIQIPNTEGSYSYNSNANEINMIQKEVVMTVDATFYLK